MAERKADSPRRSTSFFSGPFMPLRRPSLQQDHHSHSHSHNHNDSSNNNNNNNNIDAADGLTSPRITSTATNASTSSTSTSRLPSNAISSSENHLDTFSPAPLSSTSTSAINGMKGRPRNPSNQSHSQPLTQADLEAGASGGPPSGHQSTSAWGSGSNPNASGFSGLEGRSYRFQPIPDIGSPHSHAHGNPLIMSQSYTATSNTIRDSTARLASMALLSDEEGGTGGLTTNPKVESGFEQINEESPQVSPALNVTQAEAELSLLSSSQSKRLSPKNLSSSQTTGPSNLTMAMSAGRSQPPSEATSPQDEVKTLLTGREEGEGAVNERSPLLGKASTSSSSSSSATQPQSAASGSENNDGASQGLQPFDPHDRELNLRGRSAGTSGISFKEPSSNGKHRKSEVSPMGIGNGQDKNSRNDSSSRSRERDDGVSLRGHGKESSSGVSIDTGDRDDADKERQRERNSTNAYGYGALAQAQAAISARRQSKSKSNKAEHSQFGSAFPDHQDDNSEDGDEDDERTSLLKKFSHKVNPTPKVKHVLSSARKLTRSDLVEAGKEPIRLLPAVILGSLLNILDGVSYGMITFPTAYPIFSKFGGDGVSMFFVSCILSQIVYSTMSIFRGGNGSMMIEVVPFFHILVNIIIDEIGDEDPEAVIATVIVAFALSSILIGLAFLLMGLLRLGVLIGFFPRHILVGCIGGVGIFLIETGLEVTSRLQSEEGFQYNLDTLKYLFQSGSMISLWLPPLGLAILLRFITTRFHHPLVFPGFFLAIPVVFYIVAVAIMRVPLDTLRENGWLFDIGKEASGAPFYRYYSYFNFSKTSISALWATMPTQLALVFFGVLHVPLNVPALGISIGEDNVDTDRELVAHGVSNILAGLVGTVPNYLCYVNSVLFYRVGGGSVLSGFMLAGATFAIMLAGPGTISYLPVMIVGALIFVLGIDLAKEALWDTIGRVNGWEYVTIWIIVVVMTYWDFVIGILAGIIFACLFFVVQTSRRKTVRAIFDGSVARSTVRRHMTQRQFLESVGTQTQIMKLQGFLFFGTINSVENLVRKALDIAAWDHKPIRFLIVDFSLVSGVDFSAAEAFTRVQRLLATKDVVLVLCGLTPEGDVGKALQSVDMWADRGIRVEVFANLNEALEWTENEYLRGMYSSTSSAAKAFGQASLAKGGGLDVPDVTRKPAFNLSESFENSPRRSHLHEAAQTALNGHGNANPLGALPSTPNTFSTTTTDSESKSRSDNRLLVAPTAGTVARPSMVQPLPLLIITFKAYATEDMNEQFFSKLTKYFKAVHLVKDEVLWERGDEPDGLYLIESGMLKARYEFQQEGYEINEAMLAGTIAGELSFLSRQARNTTVHAAMDSQLWRLDAESLTALEVDSPETFGDFIKMLLRVTGEEQDCLMSYLVSRLS